MARIQPKEIYKSPNEAESRFLKVINQYDKFYNKQLRDNRTWQLVGLLSIVMLICTVMVCVYVMSSKKDNYVVIEVNELGRAKYVGNVSNGGYLKGYVVEDYMVESILRDFIAYTRSVYADQEVMQLNYQKAAAWCETSMQTKLQNELIAEDPFAMIGRARRDVIIESGIKQTEHTWQYDWFDINMLMNGVETGRVRYRGMFTVIVNEEPVTEDERMRNPLGVYIVDYNIVRVDEVIR